ncbi:MAG: hypothetical protein ACYC66_12700 [Chloroflexota bacterium]
MTDAGTILSLALFVAPLLIVLLMAVYDSLPWVASSRQDAQARADLLVRALLSATEYEQLSSRGYLDVRSPTDPQRVYRIPSGTGLVTVMDRGYCVERLCVQSTAPIPEQEAVIVHKLMIEGNEEEYLKLANHFPCVLASTHNSI